MIIPHYYENPLILHVGTMPVRSYYVPQSPEASEAWDGRHSDRVMTLDGEWMFRYFPSVSDLDDGVSGGGFDRLAPGFSDPSFDPVGEGFHGIPVPSVWQMNGYDRPQYVNERYPFPCDPPFVPVDDPCGLYRRTFDYHRNPDAPRAFLDFDGVDSCFFLWVNGTFAGYSQIAHATSEFEVTDRLVDGGNAITVLVLKWCDGSYLEDQDKFRTSGIFRSVSLVTRPYCAVFDYVTTTDIEWGDDGRATGATIGIGLRYLDDRPIDVGGRLLDADGHTVARAVPEPMKGPLTAATPTTTMAATTNDGDFMPQARIVMHVDDPDLWTAETPCLYTLMLESPHEVIRDTVGIREVSVHDGVLLVNRRPVTLHGVNMHDSDPVTGPAVSEEGIMRDLVMMKRHNVNAIRTSHYPSSPYAYHLYDRLGFYVVSEADNEAHGAGVLIGDDMSDEAMARRWNRPVADNPDFVEPIVDRVRHCVEREKNRPCVIIWSMGNESAYGRGFEAALRWTKTFDPTRLTHYESAIYTDGERSHSFDDIDIYSRMYPSIESIREHLSSGRADYGEGDDHPRRPYLLCEFCHAMGNGPGDLEDYFQVIDSHPGMAGGFVWEWCDHAIADGRGANGRTRYLYGGDSGEYLHDGNFCVDGLVYPDRRPHVGLEEFANVFRPLRVASVDVRGRVLALRSHLDFLDASELIRAELEVTVDGRMVGSVDLGIPPIPARSTVAVPMPSRAIELVPDEGVCRFIIRYRLSRPWGPLPEGAALGFDEVPVPTRDPSNVEVRGLVDAAARRARSAGAVESMRSGRRLVVEGDGFRYVLDCGTGMFSSMTYRGRSVLARPMEVNIWRAPTDNDIEVSRLWRRSGYDHASTRAGLLSVDDEDGAVRIEVAMKVVAPGVQPIAEVQGDWLVRRDGSVDLSMDVHRTEGFPFLPRFGVRMFVPRSMGRIEYCGLGPRESYVDKRRSSWHGVFHGAPEEFVEPYPRPQENGNHHDCEWMSLSDGDLRMSFVGLGRTFDGQVLPYTQEELAGANHDCDLRRSDWNVACVDYLQSGVGSNSCGPELARRYRLDAGDFRFSVGFVPEVL